MKILKLSKRTIRIIKQFVEDGKVIILPTDTVYILACSSKKTRAVRRVFKIKKRPFSKAFPLFVKDIKMAKRFAQIDKDKERMLKKFWPGKVTFVLKRKGNLPKIIFGKKKTIGLRIPDYKLFKVLFKEINFPIVQTSANISEMPATTKIKEALKYFEKSKEKPDLVIDAGNLKKARPSTVVDLSGKELKILRQGEVKIDDVGGLI